MATRNQTRRLGVSTCGMGGLWIFFISVMIPLMVWVVWLGHDLWETKAEPRREAKRLAEVVAFRQRYMGVTGGNDPSAHESLGDALKSAGHSREALAAFEQALALGSQSSGLEVKIRLMKLDIAQSADPKGFGMTMATRDIICPVCRNLAPAGTLECSHCGAHLPVDTLKDAWSHGPFRRLLLKDARSTALQWFLICLAAACAFAMPDMAMTASILLATLGVVLFLLLRRLGDPG